MKKYIAIMALAVGLGVSAHAEILQTNILSGTAGNSEQNLEVQLTNSVTGSDIIVAPPGAVSCHMYDSADAPYRWNVCVLRVRDGGMFLGNGDFGTFDAVPGEKYRFYLAQRNNLAAPKAHMGERIPCTIVWTIAP